MLKIDWPERSTCHDATQPLEWKGPQKIGEPNDTCYRFCRSCHSIHPEDLFNALEAGAVIMGVNYEDDWPNTLYVVDIPNPDVGKIVKVGDHRHRETVESEWVYTDIMGPAPATMQSKWCSLHLSELNSEAFAALATLLSAKSAIEWGRNEQGVYYRGPYGDIHQIGAK